MTDSNSKRDLMRPADWAALVLLSICVLLPIWIVRYPAAADYWNHLLKARIVADYNNPALGYSQFYKISFLPIPNMASTIVMAALMKLFTPLISGKLFLSIYAILLPLSARYLVRSAGVRFRALEYIGFAMVYNPCFWDGYIDSCLSVAIAQFAIGYWLRIDNKVNPRNAVIYLAMAFATYFTHLWGFVALFGITFMLAVRETKAKRLLWLGSAAIAIVLLSIYSRGTSERLSIYYFGASYTLSLARNFLSLPRLAGLPADFTHFASAGVLIVIRLALLTLMLALAAKQKNRMFWVAIALLAAFFLFPNQLGRMREPGQRTLVFVPAILAAAVSIYPSRRATRALSLLIIACSLFAVLFTARAWMAKDRDLQIYHEALMRIPAHEMVLNVVTLKSNYLKWPYKLLGSDMYRSEGFFGANYNLEKGGFYLHTFTTGLVKVRDHASPVKPWFMMDSGFMWPEWLMSNRDVVKRTFDYVVVVGPRVRVNKTLYRDFEPCWSRKGVELLKRRSNPT